jgi:tetratricopeptide (TPR) repeat protein
MLAFRRACDEDICPMRAISAITDGVREVARERGAGCVSGLPNVAFSQEHFYDHVHLRPAATFVLAGLLLPEIVGPGYDAKDLASVHEEILAERDRARDAAELRKLTQMLTWLKQPHLAIRAARDAVELDGSAESWVVLGSLKADGDPDGAKRCFAKALTEDPDSATAHYRMGLALEKERDLAAAAAHLKAATTAAPEFSAAWEKLAMVQVARGRINDAVWCFEKVVALDPKRSAAHSNLGLAYAKQGEPRKAFASYGEALRLDPRNPSAHYNKGLLHEARGDRTQAIEEFRAVLRILPTHRNARTHLAELGAPFPR